MESIKDFINFLTTPWVLISLSTILLFVSARYRDIFYSNKAALILFPGMFLFLAVSMLDEDFLSCPVRAMAGALSTLVLLKCFQWSGLVTREDMRFAGCYSTSSSRGIDVGRRRGTLFVRAVRVPRWCLVVGRRAWLLFRAGFSIAVRIRVWMPVRAP